MWKDSPKLTLTFKIDSIKGIFNLAVTLEGKMALGEFSKCNPYSKLSNFSCMSKLQNNICYT